MARVLAGVALGALALAAALAVRADGPRGQAPMNSGNMPGRSSRSLADLDPEFRRRLEALIGAMAARGHRPTIRETWRSPDRQAYYVDQGWSEVRRSFHTVTTADGRPAALAADLSDGRWNPDDDAQAAFYRDLRDLARAHGLRSGGEWARRGKWAAFDLGWDPGHVEPVGVSIAEAHAGARPWAVA